MEIFSSMLGVVITIMFVSLPVWIELNIFRKEKQNFRLAIVIPFAIILILNTQISNLLSSNVQLLIRIVGIISVIIYYSYAYKFTKGKKT